MKRTIPILIFIYLFSVIVNAQTQDTVLYKYLQENFRKFDKKVEKGNGVYIDGKVVTIIIDANGQAIEGTVLPTTYKESEQYIYRIVVITTENDKSIYSFKIDGKMYNPYNDFTILNPLDEDAKKDSIAEFADKKTHNYKFYSSDTSKVFSEEVVFQVKKNSAKKDTIIFNWKIWLTSTKTYHVSIMGGYYYSFLNNPENIVKAPLPGTSDSTLIGDFTNNQRKITITAVFYPWERTSDYRSGDLKWYERFSGSFGIGIDEDLVDDLFLGINIELTRGAYLTGGLHYGKHNILATNPNFKYGKDTWDIEFNNSLIKEQWDYKLYAGVNIDLRVISSLYTTRNKINKNSD